MNNAFWTATAELQWKVLMNELTWKEMCMNSNTGRAGGEKKKQTSGVYNNWADAENGVMLRCWLLNAKLMFLTKSQLTQNVTHTELQAVELFIKMAVKGLKIQYVKISV